MAQWIPRLLEATIDNPKFVLYIAATVIGYNALVQVPSGTIAIQVHKLNGRRDCRAGVFPPGLHLQWPFLTRIVLFDLHPPPQRRTLYVDAADGNTVELDVVIQYYPDAESVEAIYEALGREYAGALFPDIISAAVSRIAASMPASECIRLLQSGAYDGVLRDYVAGETAKYFVNVDDLRVTRAALRSAAPLLSSVRTIR